MAHSTEKVWSLYRRPLQTQYELHGFNLAGVTMLAAAVAGCFHLIQVKLDEQGKALYLPSFAMDEETKQATGGYEADQSGYFAAPAPGPLRVPEVEISKLQQFRPGSDLPPAPPAQPPAPPAQPMGGTAPPAQTYTITPGLLQKIIQNGGGLGPDGCLAQPLQSAQAFVYPPPTGTTTAIAQVKGTAKTVVFRFEADQVMCIQEAQG